MSLERIGRIAICMMLLGIARVVGAGLCGDKDDATRGDTWPRRSSE